MDICMIYGHNKVPGPHYKDKNGWNQDIVCSRCGNVSCRTNSDRRELDEPDKWFEVIYRVTNPKK